MFTHVGQVHRCQNRECGCEIRINRAPVYVDANLRCSCGAEMKKIYRKPVFRVRISVVDSYTARRAAQN
jgi:hypothetical protein